MLLRLVEERTYFMNEAEIRDAYTYGTVGIHYAFNNYGHSVEHVLKLRQKVLKDYPNMKDSEMEVRELTRAETIRHASFTTLYIGIPIDEYVKLRNAGKLDIK